MINVNEYFDGAVKSLAYTSANGKSTVGVIDSGEYEFGTSTHETMTVIEGELMALLPGKTDWQFYASGQSFEVAANASFKVKCQGQTSYLCTYQ